MLENLSQNIWTRIQKNQICEWSTFFPLSKYWVNPSSVNRGWMYKWSSLTKWHCLTHEKSKCSHSGQLYKPLEKNSCPNKPVSVAGHGYAQRAMHRWQHPATAPSHDGVRRIHPGAGFGGCAEVSALAFCCRNALTRVWILCRFSREGKASKLHNYAIVITQHKPNETE